MKKIYLLPILSFLLFNCSSNENGDNGVLNDSLIGSWQTTEYVQVYLDGSMRDVSSIYERCHRITFFADGTFIDKEYRLENGDTGDCVLHRTEEGLWETLDDDNYPNSNYLLRFYTEGSNFMDYLDSGRPEILFPNNNTMIFKYDFGDEEDNWANIDYTFEGFIRIN